MKKGLLYLQVLFICGLLLRPQGASAQGSPSGQTGGAPSSVGTGSAIGSAIGGAFGRVVAGTVGQVAGSVAGGYIGGLFDQPEQPGAPDADRDGAPDDLPPGESPSGSTSGPADDPGPQPPAGYQAGGSPGEFVNPQNGQKAYWSSIAGGFVEQGADGKFYVLGQDGSRTELAGANLDAFKMEQGELGRNFDVQLPGSPYGGQPQGDQQAGAFNTTTQTSPFYPADPGAGGNDGVTAAPTEDQLASAGRTVQSQNAGAGQVITGPGDGPGTPAGVVPWDSMTQQQREAYIRAAGEARAGMLAQGPPGERPAWAQYVAQTTDELQPALQGNGGGGSGSSAAYPILQAQKLLAGTLRQLGDLVAGMKDGGGVNEVDGLTPNRRSVQVAVRVGTFGGLEQRPIEGAVAGVCRPGSPC